MDQSPHGSDAGCAVEKPPDEDDAREAEFEQDRSFQLRVQQILDDPDGRALPGLQLDERPQEVPEVVDPPVQKGSDRIAEEVGVIPEGERPTAQLKSPEKGDYNDDQDRSDEERVPEGATGREDVDRPRERLVDQVRHL